MGGGGTLRGADGDRAPAAGAEDRGGDQALGPGGDRRRGVEAEDLDGGNRARGPGADHPQAAGAEGRGGDRARAPASGDRRGGGDTARGTDGDRPQEAGVDDHHRGGGPSCGGAYGRARVPSGDCHVSARADCCDGHEEGISRPLLSSEATYKLWRHGNPNHGETSTSGFKKIKKSGLVKGEDPMPPNSDPQELRTFEVGVEYMSDAEKINIANQDLVDIYNEIAKARREIIRELFFNSWKGDDWREEPLHKDQENFYCPAGMDRLAGVEVEGADEPPCITSPKLAGDIRLPRPFP
uniref:Uncharacterized protein n=1 Tax=Oryza meridionalis TaxID=40149 RepID=A0A0E0DXJ3_9ORYZ